MLASNNTLSPANGSPVIVPTQDIVLGLYYPDPSIKGAQGGEGKVFSNTDEVRSAFDAGAVSRHAKVTVRMAGKRVETTVGKNSFLGSNAN